jgi:hypothetical protein
MASMQRLGMKPSKDRRCRELLRKFREFLKKEINAKWYIENLQAYENNRRVG